MKFSWIVKGMLSLLLGLSLISCEFDSGTTDAVNYGYLPDVFSDESGDYISISANIYMTVLPQPANPAYYIVSFGANEGGLQLFVYSDPDEDHIGFYHNLFDVAPGTWKTTAACVAVDGWYNVVMTLDMSDDTHDPIIYVEGANEPLTEVVTPDGAAFSRIGNLMVVGNLKNSAYDYNRPFDGLIKDVRVYNVILTQAEATSLAAGGNVTRGMVFQGPCVRTSELADFEDLTLTTEKLIDNMYGQVGTPNNSVITRLIP